MKNNLIKILSIALIFLFNSNLFADELDIKANQLNLNSMKKNIDLNLSKIDELGLSAEDLQSLRLSLSNINTQLMLLDDSVQALNNYKNQLNQVILEIQTQVSSIQNESIGNN